MLRRLWKYCREIGIEINEREIECTKVSASQARRMLRNMEIDKILCLEVYLILSV